MSSSCRRTRLLLGNTLLFVKLCLLHVHVVPFSKAVRQISTNQLIIHAFRTGNQPDVCRLHWPLCQRCHLWSWHQSMHDCKDWVLSTVSVICTRYPGCCPPHSSVSVRLCLSHFCIAVFLFVYMYLFVLAFCPLLQPLPPLTTSFITSSGVPRMQKSRSPVLRTQRCPRHSLLSLTQPQRRLACFVWCQELCLFFFFSFFLFFFLFLSIYFSLTFNSHFQLNIKWHASRALDQFILVSQWGTVDAEIKVSSIENPEQTNVLPLKPWAG